MTRFRFPRRGLRARAPRSIQIGLARLVAPALFVGVAAGQELIDGRVDIEHKITAANTSSLFLDTGDQFGRAVTSLGDLDGDGITELAVGAHNDDGGGTQGLDSNNGGLWILFMRADGTVRDAQKINANVGNFTGHLDHMDQFGRALTALGDVDADGIPDLAVGSARDDDGGNNHGAVWILFLNADGTVKRHQKISDTEGNFTAQLDDFDEFGRSIAPIGDLDGDNVLDLAVGAIGDDDGGDMRGAVYILFMNPDFTVKSHQKISQTSGNFQGLLRNGDAFGIDVAEIGDLNNDGVPDLAVGAPKDRGLTYREGALWILFMKADGTCLWQQRINRIEGGFTGNGWHECYEFGTSVTSLGDIDRDGVQDLAVGAILDGELGQGHGAVWILFMNTNGTVKDQGKINDAHGGLGSELHFGDWFGSSVASIGDLDGNGTRDLAVGARFDDQSGQNTGALYVLMLDGAQQASLTFRNGSNVNPVAYSSLVDPVMGTTWVGHVDTALQPDIYLTYLIGFDRLLPTPLTTAFGELIIDVTSALFLLTPASAVNGSSTHFVPVPIDPALEGFTIYTQAMGFGNQINLFNGLDLFVGY